MGAHCTKHLLIWLLLALALLPACANSSSSGEEIDTDTGTGTDSDTDVDTDIDTDTDSDTDGDTDTDTDVDTDTDTDADSDSDTDADSDADTEEDTLECVDDDSDWWCASIDCDDSDSSVFPNQDEIPDNGVDDDCDGLTDEEESSSSDSDSDVCYEEELEIEPVITRVVILQDTSGSMDEGFPLTKWEHTVLALATLLSTWGDSDIEFGFDFFPNYYYWSSCGFLTAMKVPPGPDTEDQILDFLYWYAPIGATPLYCAMNQFLELDYAEGFPEYGYESYLLVVSDGQDTCGTLPYLSVECFDGINEDFGDYSIYPYHLTAKTEELLDLGIKTIAIGFGSDVDPVQLNAIAAAGGTPFTEYLHAEDAVELNDALETIVSEVAVECLYYIGFPDEEEVDPDEVNFYFDGDVVPYDEECADGVGWTWADPPDNTQVQFCEEACAELQSEVEIISATWGCPSVID
jgi:hypothetical protein